MEYPNLGFHVGVLEFFFYFVRVLEEVLIEVAKKLLALFRHAYALAHYSGVTFIEQLLVITHENPSPGRGLVPPV